MKFAIAAELQRRWVENPPRGWTAAREVDLLPVDERMLLGYRPLVDVVLTHRESQQRLWIEIEVSRADPVANHAKFASANLLRPINSHDAFVSLVSNHVTRGRANLAAHIVFLMRKSGIRAFHMPLLAGLSGSEVSRINQGKVSISNLPTPCLKEIIELTHPVAISDEAEIFYATNKLEVLLNIRQWNLDSLDRGNREAWNYRRVKYLVYDKQSGSFAPSKFCAYTRMEMMSSNSQHRGFVPSMTIQAYSRIPQDCGIFDGQKAWKCLARLGFHKIKASEASSPIKDRLGSWVRANASLIRFDPREGELLIEG